MFTGLSAFPLTPMSERGIQEAAFTRLIERLTAAGVDSIGALGSTGSYAYLTRAERARVAELAVASAGDTPVMIGIGALRTRDVLALAEDAQHAGASGVLLAPVSYQTLNDDEVFGLYDTVCRELSVPLCVYDNPGTTHFAFSDELHGRIAQLSQVRSIKIPGVAGDVEAVRARVERLRRLIPSDVSIGISGDPLAAIGLAAGCDGWYSAIGGLYPRTMLAITRAVQSGDAEQALALSARLAPLWEWFRQHAGSLRVIATAAELQGLVSHPSLPLPLKTLEGADRQALAEVLSAIELD